MNKKKYQKPTIKVVKLQQLQMMCSSPKTLRGSSEYWQELD